MDISYNEALALFSLLGLFASMATGFPIAYTLMFSALLFGYLGIGKVVFFLMTQQFYMVMADPILGAIPLFLFMGYLLDGAGLMERLFRSFQMLFARLPGSLYAATTVTGTLFACATGIVASGVNLLCIMAEPNLRRSGYDVRMSAGCIAAAGTLGIIIPPSIMLIVLGPIVGVPVTALFAAAIIPGLTLSGIYITYTLVRCALNPTLGPPLPKEMWPTNLGMVIKEVFIGAVPLVVLIACVLGVILTGIATTTEAAACGSFGALILITVYRRMTWALFKRALYQTLLLSAMILVLIAACNFFGAVFARLGGAAYLSNLLMTLDFAPWIMVVIILVSLFLIGWALEWIPLILVFVPLTLPAVQAMGFDMLWYAILVALVLQTSWLTPPVALSGYFIKGCIPHWDLMDIYKGMIQFVGCQIVGIIIFMIFPVFILGLPIYVGLWK